MSDAQARVTERLAEHAACTAGASVDVETHEIHYPCGIVIPGPHKGLANADRAHVAAALAEAGLLTEHYVCEQVDDKDRLISRVALSMLASHTPEVLNFILDRADDVARRWDRDETGAADHSLTIALACLLGLVLVLVAGVWG